MTSQAALAVGIVLGVPIVVGLIVGTTLGYWIAARAVVGVVAAGMGWVPAGWWGA